MQLNGYGFTIRFMPNYLMTYCKNFIMSMPVQHFLQYLLQTDIPLYFERGVRKNRGVNLMSELTMTIILL